MKQAVLSRVEGGVVCERCSLARTVLARLRGLLGRAELPRGEGMLLRPAGSVHTAFMRFPIDVVFLDRRLTVLEIAPDVPAWRTRSRRGAKAVLELPAGECERRGLAVGDALVLSS
jgi:uncharacterized protein